jgi:hypothetical protein
MVAVGVRPNDRYIVREGCRSKIRIAAPPCRHDGSVALTRSDRIWLRSQRGLGGETEEFVDESGRGMLG